jgi:hypothetical protein
MPIIEKIKTRRIQCHSHLFALDVSGSQIFNVNTNGSNLKVIVEKCQSRDGIAMNIEARPIYWR